MIRYNPCGRVVDMGRDAGRTRALMYPDDDTEYTLEWYVCRDDAPLLGMPSAINNIALVKDIVKDQVTAVGEVFGAPWTKRPNTPKLIAMGHHVCGTRADFGGRGTLNPNAPFVEYLDSGLPSCCGGLFEGRGGLVLGGTADVSWRGPYTGAGGLVVGGTVAQFYAPRPVGGLVVGGAADVQYSGELVGTGGLVVGGEADEQYTTWEEGTGGLVVGGEADEQYTDAWIGTGGLVVGGEADEQYTQPAAGGLVVGGTADETYTTWADGAGGLVVGGVATIYAGALYTGAGGLVVGGTADETYTTWADGAGGLVVGGTADETYTPPGPTPGNSCATAGAFSVGQSYTGPAPTGFAQDWFTFPQVNGTTYTVHFTAAGAFDTCNAGHGTCPLPVSDGNRMGTGIISWTAGSTATGFIWFPGSFGGGTYTVSLTSP